MSHPRKIIGVMITPLRPHNGHFPLSPGWSLLRAEVRLYHV